jgi:hypothetical protein
MGVRRFGFLSIPLLVKLSLGLVPEVIHFSVRPARRFPQVKSAIAHVIVIKAFHLNPLSESILLSQAKMSASN